jgi:DNA-directed RNA polymerase specialized sigma24 family protein
MSNEKQHEELMGVLNTLLKIQALSAVRHLASKKEKILFLAEVGLTPKDIAPIVSTSAASVSQTVYASKKAEKGEK